jgi:hypothetical protein
VIKKNQRDIPLSRQSESIALPQDLEQGFQQDLDIQRETPIVDVPKVHFNPAGKMQGLAKRLQRGSST